MSKNLNFPPINDQTIIAYKTTAEASELCALAGRHGATAVAIGKGFVHCAWRDIPDGDKRIRTWSY